MELGNTTSPNMTMKTQREGGQASRIDRLINLLDETIGRVDKLERARETVNPTPAPDHPESLPCWLVRADKADFLTYEPTFTHDGVYVGIGNKIDHDGWIEMIGAVGEIKHRASRLYVVRPA
jgi:hypothetical protein